MSKRNAVIRPASYDDTRRSHGEVIQTGDAKCADFKIDGLQFRSLCPWTKEEAEAINATVEKLIDQAPTLCGRRNTPAYTQNKTLGAEVVTAPSDVMQFELTW